MADELRASQEPAGPACFDEPSRAILVFDV